MIRPSFSYLRSQVRDIQAATAAGCKGFEDYAKRCNAKIMTCRYNEIGYIWCDTLAFKDGRMIVTEQNLQYYPAKIRYFFRYRLLSEMKDNEPLTGVVYYEGGNRFTDTVTVGEAKEDINFPPDICESEASRIVKNFYLKIPS